MYYDLADPTLDWCYFKPAIPVGSLKVTQIYSIHLISLIEANDMI